MKDPADEERRVRAYLHALGVDADATEAAALTLDRLLPATDEWARSLAQTPSGAGSLPGLLLARLRPLLREHPEVFLKRPPAGDAAAPQSGRLLRAVPDSAPGDMPCQQFGNVLSVFRGAFWCRIGAGIYQAAFKRKDAG